MKDSKPMETFANKNTYVKKKLITHKNEALSLKGLWK
jgi:hypothetical protein